MILREKYKKPRISFGLAKVEATIALGETIKVCQNEIYNSDTYNFIFNTLNQPIYGFELTPVATGTLEIEASIETKDGSIILPSNKIFLLVVLTADNTTIKADNNLITVDNG